MVNIAPITRKIGGKSFLELVQFEISYSIERDVGVFSMPGKCFLRIRKGYLHLFIFFLYFSNILFIVGFDASFCLRRKKEWRRNRHQLQNGKIQEMRVSIVFTRQRFFSLLFYHQASTISRFFQIWERAFTHLSVEEEAI